MWTVYTPSDQSWITYNIEKLSTLLYIGIISAYLSMILVWIYKKSKIILGIQILFVCKMVTTDLGWDLRNHGGWNLVCFLISTFLCLFIVGSYLFLRKLWKSGKVGKIIVIFMGIILLSWIIKTETVIVTKTEEWKKGF